jgi:hypothetical protein
VRFLDCTPDIAGPTPRDIVISIEPYRGYFRIIEDGVVLKEALDGHSATQFLHAHLFGCSIADRPRAALLHAACLRRGGRRLLLHGAKAAGYEIEGDEHVFVGVDAVVARPRGCRVKEYALPHLGDLATIVAAAPFYQDSTIGRVFNVDPRTLGSPNWCIEPGAVDHVIELQPNHDGYSSIRPMRPSALIQMLMTDIGLTRGGRGAALGAVVAIGNRAKAFDLSLGDLETAIRCVELATQE